MTQTENNTKPTLKGVAVTIYSEMERKRLEKMQDHPGCQEAKLFGCTCNSVENRGGFEGRIDNGRFYIPTNPPCQFHAWLLKK